MKHLRLLAFSAGLFTLIASCNNATESTTETNETTMETTAQDAEKAMRDVADSYQAAYNNEDVAGLKNLFTADAVRIEADGKTINGRDSIGKLYEDAFAASDTKLVIMQQTAELQSDGSIHSTGTWQVTGKTSAGEPLDRKGTYDVTDVQEGGQWKIKKQVITEEK